MNCLPFTVDNIINICSNVCYDDSYIVSPTYYMMTGRKGGEIFEEGKRFVIAVQHPNKDDAWLVFPSISKFKKWSDGSLEIKVANTLLENKQLNEVVIARLPQSAQLNYPFKLVEETLLDWKYPVQIIDVKSVVEHIGKGYQQLRQRLNHIDQTACRAYSIDVFDDENVIRTLTNKWASEFPYKVYSGEDLLSPTEILIKFMKQSKLNIFGQIIYFGEDPAAFSIWEESKKIANVYSMTANRNIPGLAELNIVSMCKMLFERGIEYANLGGSESEGLNRFKRKFAPISSIYLKSSIVH